MLATGHDLAHAIVGELRIESMISQSARGHGIGGVPPLVVVVGKLSQIRRIRSSTERGDRQGESPQNPHQQTMASCHVAYRLGSYKSRQCERCGAYVKERTGNITLHCGVLDVICRLA